MQSTLEMKETTKAEDKPEMKIRRKITSLDDDELWAGFEWEETDKILSGEIKPKTLITTYLFEYIGGYPQRGHLIAQEMLSVFPNSRYLRRGIKSQLSEVIALAKKRGCTSLIMAHTNHCGHDELCIINLLNCALATFRVIDLIPRADIPNCANPPTASILSCIMIQSLFPKVSPSRRRSFVWMEKQNNLIFFRHLLPRLKEKAVAGESSSVGTQMQECGPRFALKLMAVQRVSFDTGGCKMICIG